MKFNLKYSVVFDLFFNSFMLIGGVLGVVMLIVIARNNLRLYRAHNDSTISYFSQSSNIRKSQFLKRSIGSMMVSILCTLAICFVFVDIYVPSVKEIPYLISDEYSYTVGTVVRVDKNKQRNTILISGFKVYETKHIFGERIKPGKKYKIAYLKNTHICVGVEEVK
ncbi:hypothetical protein [Clostridium cellulovorans]|uniref:hypothetical protein n=1 Tax=Clostridium cellulovorans TaxID=1493 RepID=UPI0002F65D58|nr:hypothetical protein [Clostridium cellulovorans]